MHHSSKIQTCIKPVAFLGCVYLGFHNFWLFLVFWKFSDIFNPLFNKKAKNLECSWILFSAYHAKQREKKLDATKITNGRWSRLSQTVFIQTKKTLPFIATSTQWSCFRVCLFDNGGQTRIIPVSCRVYGFSLSLTNLFRSQITRIFQIECYFALEICRTCRIKTRISELKNVITWFGAYMK